MFKRGAKHSQANAAGQRKISTASHFHSRIKEASEPHDSDFATNRATNPKKIPMPPFRSPNHLSKSSALLSARPARSLLQSRLLPARTLASTHPPDVSEHPSTETATHESHYDPPSGWLFGVPPGQKYQKEGWENTWVYGFWGSLLFGVVAYAYKPDTS